MQQRLQLDGTTGGAWMLKSQTERGGGPPEREH
jgi:hypothetical protein